MTQLRIGWFGVEHTQDHIASITETAAGLEVSGRISHTPPAPFEQDRLGILRAQLIGLAEQPTVAQPVTIDTDPHLDGWYYVTDANVDLDPGAYYTGWWPYKITLTRAGRDPVPVLEARIVGALRPNDQSRTGCVGWQAIPDGSTLVNGPATVATPTRRATDEGLVRTFTAGTNGLLNTFLSWRTPPAVALVGAARIRTGKVDPLTSTAYAYTGAFVQTYTVPADTERIRVDVRGAQGGGTWAGEGARVICEINVTPGETLDLRVGGKGGRTYGGFNGGGHPGSGTSTSFQGYGGGGGTDIRRGSTRLVVAGGGGGQNAYPTDGYAFQAGNGGEIGQDGYSPPSGKGGTATAGGAGGDGTNDGSPGTAGSGGAGGNLTFISPSVACYGGGGGGGGYYGGGGGGSGYGYRTKVPLWRPAGSGAGGSSLGTGFTQSIVSGYQRGDGQVIITPIRGDEGVASFDRHTVTGLSIEDSPFGWEISNGIINVTPAYRGDAFMLSVRTLTPTAGANDDSYWQLNDVDGTTPAAMTVTGAEVLVNTAELVVLRVSLQAASEAVAASVTLSLRRGSPIVDTRLVATEALDWGWVRATADAGTAVGTGAIQATTADGFGNRWLITTVEDATAILTGQSGFSYAADPKLAHTYGLGYVPAGFPHTAAQLVDQWFAATTTTIRAVNG